MERQQLDHHPRQGQAFPATRPATSACTRQARASACCQATDFASVRRLLEEALKHVEGADQASGQVREALELLIEAALTAETYPAQGRALAIRRASTER